MTINKEGKKFKAENTKRKEIGLRQAVARTNMYMGLHELHRLPRTNKIERMQGTQRK